MKIALYAVGRMKAGPERELAGRYFDRLAKDCPAPARPNPPAPKDEDIVFKGDAPTPRSAPRSEPEISYGPTRYVVGPEDPQTGLPR